VNVKVFPLEGATVTVPTPFPRDDVNAPPFEFPFESASASVTAVPSNVPPVRVTVHVLEAAPRLPEVHPDTDSATMSVGAPNVQNPTVPTCPGAFMFWYSVEIQPADRAMFDRRTSST
jgi:hypothetical protein